jgi:hypothetical protein
MVSLGRSPRGGLAAALPLGETGRKAGFPSFLTGREGLEDLTREGLALAWLEPWVRLGRGEGLGGVMGQVDRDRGFKSIAVAI